MSTRRRRSKRRFGCLFTISVLALAVYYGMDPANLWFKTWQLREEMKAQAGFAPSIDDAAIRRRLLRKIENLELPDEARSTLRIRRTLRPREVIISTQYEVSYVLPFWTMVDTLNLEVRSPL